MAATLGEGQTVDGPRMTVQHSVVAMVKGHVSCHGEHNTHHVVRTLEWYHGDSPLIKQQLQLNSPSQLIVA